MAEFWTYAENWERDAEAEITAVLATCVSGEKPPAHGLSSLVKMSGRRTGLMSRPAYWYALCELSLMEENFRSATEAASVGMSLLPPWDARRRAFVRQKVRVRALDGKKVWSWLLTAEKAASTDPCFDACETFDGLVAKASEYISTGSMEAWMDSLAKASELNELVRKAFPKSDPEIVERSLCPEYVTIRKIAESGEVSESARKELSKLATSFANGAEKKRKRV